MNADTIRHPKVHHGRNIKRLRDILGVKQEAIATELDITQQSVSKLETKELIEDELLDKIAAILHVPVDAIKNFNEEATVNFIANTFQEGSIGNTNYGTNNIQCSFNPIDKIVELYDQIVKTEREKSELLERTLEKLAGK